MTGLVTGLVTKLVTGLVRGARALDRRPLAVLLSLLAVSSSAPTPTAADDRPSHDTREHGAPTDPQVERTPDPDAASLADGVSESGTSAADECPAAWEGLDVRRTERVLVVPHEPWVGALVGSGCVGVVVVPAQPVEVRVQLVARDGRTWHEAWARPLAFVRGCGDGPRVVIEAARSVAVTVVELRDPPPELADAACRARRPGVESRPPRLGPEPPPSQALVLPPVDAPWTRDTELALVRPRRVDLGVREGCVRVDVAGAVHGGRLVIGGRAFALWGAPYGAWAAVCADGTSVLELEGEGPLAVRVSSSRASSWVVGGAESTGLRSVARGSATEAPPTQVRLRVGERLRWPARELEGCRRGLAVGADESSEARFELRALGADDALVARGRGGPGRAARVDACATVRTWELVQLGPGGRVVVEEASW